MIRSIGEGWQLVLIVLLLQAVTALASPVTVQQSEFPEQERPPDYRRYLRTRRPTLVGEKHVEEVLEVFRTEARPSAYRLNYTDVNHFLALERFHEQQRRRTTTTITPTKTRSSTVTAATAGKGTATSTYRTPTYENHNPAYRYLYRPLITATELGGTNITIKEADP
uniref:Putative secreted protein n=2 Tax=Anopheles marajoara TaxID=58244 RepID=A0A2M4C1P6_9DIPT